MRRGLQDAVGVALEREGLQQEQAEIVDVAAAGGVALRALGCLADAVTAQLDGLADREDVDRLDMLVHQADGVQGGERGNQAFGDLTRLGNGERSLAQDLAKIGVGGLHDDVDQGGVVHDDVAKLGEAKQVVLLQAGDCVPAREDLVVVIVRLNQPQNGVPPSPVVVEKKALRPSGRSRRSNRKVPAMVLPSYSFQSSMRIPVLRI